jgi:hypothetical protein
MSAAEAPQCPSFALPARGGPAPSQSWAPQCPWFAMRPQSQAPIVVCHATAVAGPELNRSRCVTIPAIVMQQCAASPATAVAVVCHASAVHRSGQDVTLPDGNPGIYPGAGASCGNPGIYPGECVMARQAAGFNPRPRVPASPPVMGALPVQIGLRLGHAHIAQAPHEVARTPERIPMQLVQVREGLPQMAGAGALQPLHR